MRLKLHTQWFNRKRKKLRNTLKITVTMTLLLKKQLIQKNENVINNGEFDLKKEWINAIQKYVTYKINPAKYTYFIAFDYRDKW